LEKETAFERDGGLLGLGADGGFKGGENLGMLSGRIPQTAD